MPAVWDANPRSQQALGRRPTPQTARGRLDRPPIRLSMFHIYAKITRKMKLTLPHSDPKYALISVTRVKMWLKHEGKESS
jgi:hypothetical protein